MQIEMILKKKTHLLPRILRVGDSFTANEKFADELLGLGIAETAPAKKEADVPPQNKMFGAAPENKGGSF